MLLWFSTMLLCLRLSHKNNKGVTLDLKLTFEEQLLNALKKTNNNRPLVQTAKCITKNNFSYYLQSLCQAPFGLWGHLTPPSF